jgi:hypothetical protein
MSFSGRSHAFNEEVHAVIDAREIDRYHAVPYRRRDLAETQAVGAHASIVNEKLDGTTLARNTFGDACPCIPVRNVERKREHVCAVLSEPLRSAFERFDVYVGEDDLHALVEARAGNA